MTKLWKYGHVCSSEWKGRQFFPSVTRLGKRWNVFTHSEICFVLLSFLVSSRFFLVILAHIPEMFTMTPPKSARLYTGYNVTNTYKYFCLHFLCSASNWPYLSAFEAGGTHACCSQARLQVFQSFFECSDQVSTQEAHLNSLCMNYVACLNC